MYFIVYVVYLDKVRFIGIDIDKYLQLYTI